MIKFLQFVLLALTLCGVSVPALAQNECTALGFQPLSAGNITDSFGVIHQNICFNPLTGQIQIPLQFSNSNFLGNVTVGGTLGVTGKSKLPNINNIIYVDGVNYPMTQTGIQSAFTDACAIAGAQNGAIVYIQPGVVSLSLTTGQQFTITCPLNVIGPGPSQLWFVVANTVPNTVPTFRVNPSASTQGWFKFEGFRLVGNGKFGGDAFFLDATTAGVNHFKLTDTEIDSLDPAAWCVNMSVGIPNSFFYGRVTDNHLGCGINMTSSTDDSWLIEHNNFSSSATDTLPCVNGTTQNGASHITLFNNNGGCNGGFFISHGTGECKILYNQIEQPAFTSTEANSAMIDLIGDTFSIDACEIRGNNLGSNGNVTIGVRTGISTNTKISSNVFGLKAVTGVGISFTAGSTSIVDGTNEFIGVGGGAVATAGTGSVTSGQYLFGTSANPTFGTLGIAGGGGINFRSASAFELITPNADAAFQWGTTNNVINNNLFFANGSVDSVSADAAICRAGVNILQVGDTANACNASGEIRSAKISATYNAAGTVQTGVHLVQDTCTLGTSCAVTLVGSAVYTNATSYTCTCHDQTTPLNVCGVNQTAGTTFTITGIGVDVIRYSCVGN